MQLKPAQRKTPEFTITWDASRNLVSFLPPPPPLPRAVIPTGVRWLYGQGPEANRFDVEETEELPSLISSSIRLVRGPICQGDYVGLPGTIVRAELVVPRVLTRCGLVEIEVAWDLPVRNVRHFPEAVGVYRTSELNLVSGVGTMITRPLVVTEGAEPTVSWWRYELGFREGTLTLA